MIRDPAQIQYSNVWQQASKLKAKDIKSSQTQRTLIVVGPQSSGKTSFIKTYKSDLDLQTKPTNIIEYTYIKKMGIKKQIIHCYQIGNKMLTQVISTLLNKDNFNDVVFVVCVDLYKPYGVVEEVMDWLRVIRGEVQRFVQEKLINRQDKYGQYRESLKQVYSENQDKSVIEPMPLQTIIVGTKYDLFQKFDTENRKWLARALRYIAHFNNCSLYFTSTKNMQIGAQLRTYFQNRFSPAQDKKKNKLQPQFQHTKPIFINNGEDSIRNMSLPTSGSMNTVEVLKKQLLSLFGEEENKKKQVIDFTKYGESRIDNVIAEKKKEIQRISKMLHNAENRSNRRI